MSTSVKPRRKPRNRRSRGGIDELPSGALRVRVYAGIDPISRKRNYLTEIIPPGPEAERLAEVAQRRLANQVDERRHPRTNATLNQLLDKHLKLLHAEESTKRTYWRYVRKHIRPLIGEQKVGRLDGHILDSFYAELLRCREHCRDARFTEHRTSWPHTCDDRCRPHVCKPLAPWTVLKIHFILSGAYERAVRWKWVALNPVSQADPPSPPPPDPQPPTPAEAARILNEAWKDLDFGTLVWVTMTTGPRRGEICGLRWKHFDAERALLTYRRSIGQDGGEIWEKDTKTHQRRHVALDPQTVTVLADFKVYCEKRAAMLGLTITPESFIFSLDPDGATPLKPGSLGQRYGRLAARLGIATSLHKLRHYSATELIAAGVDIRTVAGRLGHSGGGTTTLRVYAAWVSEADQRASTTLLDRIPARPVPPPDPIERAKTDPHAPYEKIAAGLRQKILDGSLPDGEAAPTLKQLAKTQGVASATAHRALGLLRSWGLITEGGRGHRSIITRPAEPELDEPPASPKAEPLDAGADVALLDLRLLCLGEEARIFTAEANPADPAQLRRLLAGAARRHGGKDAELSDYELEVRRHGDPELVTRFATF